MLENEKTENTADSSLPTEITVTAEMRDVCIQFAEAQRQKVYDVVQQMKNKMNLQGAGVIDPRLQDHLRGAGSEMLIWQLIVQELRKMNKIENDVRMFAEEKTKIVQTLQAVHGQMKHSPYVAADLLLDVLGLEVLK